MSSDIDIIKYQLNGLSKDELLALYRELIGYETELLDVSSFLDDTDYLGNYYGDRTFPIWRQVLKEIFPNPYTSPWSEIIIEGGVGSGKSTCAIAGALYDLYKLLNLKDPHDVFGLTPSTSIVFHIFNATLTLADDVIWSQIHDILMNSPYFKEKLLQARRTKSDCLLPKRIKFEIGSRPSHALGTAVFEAILDEMNFQTIVSSQAYKNYNRLTSRQESRFMQYGGTLPGHTWLISSADTPNSFLNLHKRNRASNKYTKCYSFPIWKALEHKGIYSGKTFKVFIGDEFLEPSIVADGGRAEHSDSRVIDVPMEYFDAFSTDIYVALRDKAGVATGKGTHKLFMSHSHVLQAMVLENYFNRDELQLDFWEDQDQLVKYFRLQDYISKRSYPDQPRFLHIDTGLTGDRLGIACCYLSGYTEVERLDESTLQPIKHREPKFQVEFATALKARPGQEIPLFKVRLFLVQEMMQRGVKIGRVTFDGFQCFTGDTKICMVNGDNIPIKELVGRESFWIYACNIRTKTKLPAKATNCRLTKKNAELVEITLCNGEKIKCTPDHRFLLATGIYKRADELLKKELLESISTLQGRKFRVTSVRHLEEREDVYDFEVDTHHNFALSAGVFVHNSRDGIQLLNKAGIKADLLSLDRGADNYICFRNSVYEGRCLLPRGSELLKKELLELQIVENKVDHELGGSKDLSDSVAGAVCNLLTYGKMADEMVTQIAAHIDSIQQSNLYEKIQRGALT